MGGIGFAGSVGAILSTTLAGFVADRLGAEAAFLGLGLVGLAGTVLVRLAMPETKPAAES
jgi:MFS family permease